MFGWCGQEVRERESWVVAVERGEGGVRVVRGVVDGGGGVWSSRVIEVGIVSV